MRLAHAGVVNSVFGIVSSAANVVLVPLLLSSYGLAVYGALSLLTSVGQYLNVLDLGLSSALVRHAVRVRTHGDPTYFAYRRAIVRLFVVVGLVLTGIAAAAAPLWAPAFHIERLPLLSVAVLGAGTLTVVTLVGNCYNSTLVAELRYAHLGAYNLARNLGPQLIAVLAYRQTGNLGIALAGASMFAIVLLGVQIALLGRQEPALAPAPAAPSREEFRHFVKDSTGFSLQYLFDAIVLPLLQSVVGVKFGPEANGIVDVARRLLFAFRRMIEAAFAPLFARAHQLIEGRDPGALRRLALRSTLLTVGLAAAYFLCLKAALPWMLDAWLGARAAAVRPVAAAFLVGVTFTIPHIALYQLLATSAQGRLVNTAGSAVCVAAILLALAPSVQSVSQVLLMYAAGTLLAAVLTFAYALWLQAGTGAEPRIEPA